jgi:hypothetical protein
MSLEAPIQKALAKTYFEPEGGEYNVAPVGN